ncbi:putative Protein kinase [Zostera marina]|uniref:non-specific serine/threonine protein kinase n=1 Tax=Zostera marina TaxID=29655 RepID=A0A0K9PQW0_ZOSMR|nr:putative Protein kinase [Zostera marina]
MDFDARTNTPGSGITGVYRTGTISIPIRAPQELFVIEDFYLRKVYGTGTYSKVIEAEKKETGSVYALKIMDKRYITKENKISTVKLERIVLDQMSHPGIVKLFFTFQDSRSLYMGLELCEGGELYDQIKRKVRLSEDETRFYASEIIDALEYLHGLGLIHRDIKPENLLLTKNGHIKIADFGSVKATKEIKISIPPNSLENKKACSLDGTSAYIPPEVLNSFPPTYGNDLWALGCTIYQMLSGTPPFKDESEWLIFQRIMARDLNFTDVFSNQAKDLIDKLLDPDPSNRLGMGHDGYATLKRHPFFNGVIWENVRDMPAPNLSLGSCTKEEDCRVQESSSTWNHTKTGNGSKSSNHQHQKAIQDGTSDFVASTDTRPYMFRIASIDSFDSKWQEFLEDGESIVMISKMKKINKLTSKKIQLIITDKPKIIRIDPSKLIAKGDIVWSYNPNELNVQLISPTHFKIFTTKKVVSFEDVKKRGLQWKKTIEELQRRC